MKERGLLLLFFCLIGLGACIFAYKHGPVSLSWFHQVAPPGWTPPAQTAPPAVPVTPAVPQTPPQQQSPRMAPG